MISQKCLFRSKYEVFWQRFQKTFNVGKVRKYDEEGMFFRQEKRFHLFKSLLYKNRKAQNKSVVAGRLFYLHDNRSVASVVDSSAGYI